MIKLMRHRQTKGAETDRPCLRKVKSCSLLYPIQYPIEFYNDAGREQEAEPFYERLENWKYLRNSAQEERSLILESDEFIPHGLDPDIVADFVGYFDRHPVIAKVYLAQKLVKYMPEYPCYVIAYRTQPKFWQTQAKVDEQVSSFIDNSGLSQDYVYLRRFGERIGIQAEKSRRFRYLPQKII